jgi:hypothetical protein
MKRISAASLKIITALQGDTRSGMCRCPLHEDTKASLSVKDGDKVPVVVHCFSTARGRNHDREVIEKLRTMGVWPGSKSLADAPNAERRAHTDEERRAYARKIWGELKRSNGRDFASSLETYLRARCIDNVPATALMSLPPMGYAEDDPRHQRMASDDPAMVLPIKSTDGKLQGVSVAWLNAAVNAKREAEPQRQHYGLVKGNFIELTELDWHFRELPDDMLIGEGVETVLTGMQLTGWHGIATGGTSFMAEVNPPPAKRYIILADNGDGGQKAAHNLARKLKSQSPECSVRVATPERPEGGKQGYDWNDALMDGADPATLREAILQSPEFDVGAKPQFLEILDELAGLDPIEYDRRRKEVATDLGIRLPVLDDEVEKRRLAKVHRTAPVVEPEVLAASARHIIQCTNVLHLFADNFRQMVAGEVTIGKLIYLASTSRLFPKAMHVVIKGTSSTGKSEIRTRVLAFFPPEDVVSFTALSERALLYFDGDFRHKILSMGEAIATDEQKFQDYLLRELMSEGKLRYPVAQRVGNAIKTVIVEKNGPVAFIVTTTKNKLHPENETRMLSLETDDSQDQTRKVMRKVAAVEGLNRGSGDIDLAPWRDYQRWLATGNREVVVPFAQALADWIPPNSVRLRRDFGQVLRAIKAHALLHREHRLRDEQGQIVATGEEDYAAIWDLMADLLAETAEVKMRKATIETIEAVRKLQPNDDNCGVVIRKIAKKLMLDRSTCWRRLNGAEADGFVVNVETRKGRAGQYRISGQVPAPIEMLPDPEKLAEVCSTVDEEACPKSAPDRKQQRIG